MQRCSAGSCMTQYGHSHAGQWIFDKVGHTFVGWQRWVLFLRIKEIVWWWLRADRELLRRGEGVCWSVLASSTDQHNDSLTVRQLEDPTSQRYLYIVSRSWRERSTASLEKNMRGSTSCVLKLRWMILSPVFNANYHRAFLSHTLHNGFSETGDLTYPRIRH